MKKRQLIFALGNLWSWTNDKNRNSLIKYAKKLDISGIEITFGYREELFAFKLSSQNLAWVKNLDYVSIHAPFNLLEESKNKEDIIKQANVISKIYHQIGAEYVVIHPEQLPGPKIINQCDFKITTENMVPKKKINILKLKKILNKDHKIKLCLDVSHAYLWSKYETQKLVNAFKDRIVQIHLSGTYRNKDHQSLRVVTQSFFESLEPIKELNVPIVIEEDIRKRNLEYAKKEIECAKKILHWN